MKHMVESESMLFDVLIKMFPDSSHSTLRSWLEHGRIHVNGRKVLKSKIALASGDVVEFLPKPLPKEGPLKIVYEDEYLVVVDKPAGLLSVARDTGKTVSAHDFLKRRYQGKKVFVIHRLDQETSGLLMFALSSEAFRSLKEALKERKIHRVYLALVEGCLEGSGTWDSYLLEDRSLRMQVVSEEVEGAERAITKYTVLKSGKKQSLIECRLVTGKKNQIRVHTAEASHPIVGDSKYGSSLPGARRLCLHATSLSFVHPITKKKMVFKSPCRFGNFGSQEKITEGSVPKEKNAT